MARRIPHVADGYFMRKDHPERRISRSTRPWAEWLEDRATRSFSFEGPSGTFTARKERRSGSDEEYWSAYRKRGGKLRKVYLGKAEKLTLARLEKAATELTGHGEHGATRRCAAGDGGPSSVPLLRRVPPRRRGSSAGARSGERAVPRYF